MERKNGWREGCRLSLCLAAWTLDTACLPYPAPLALRAGERRRESAGEREKPGTVLRPNIARAVVVVVAGAGGGAAAARRPAPESSPTDQHGLATGGKPRAHQRGVLDQRARVSRLPSFLLHQHPPPAPAPSQRALPIKAYTLAFRLLKRAKQRDKERTLVSLHTYPLTHPSHFLFSFLFRT